MKNFWDFFNLNNTKQVSDNDTNFDYQDPVPEEFYVSDDNDEIKIEENNSTNFSSNKQCTNNKVNFRLKILNWKK